jgi:hypothetical protein
LILEKPEVDVCIKDPGFDVDLVVTADIATMARVWMGAADFQHAVRSRGVRLDGPRAHLRRDRGVHPHHAPLRAPARRTYSFMYESRCHDRDGHHCRVVWMDSKAAQ